MSTRHFDLPLARDYVRHWGLTEAIRELIQNAIDSDSPFEYAFMGDTLSITSRHTTLEPKSLLLGTTSKSDDPDKIGSFGEGYKLALLVLLRLNYGVSVLNGDVLWTPSFVHSELYGAEMMRITEQPVGGNTGLTFLITGLHHEDSNRIRESCLFMQPPMTDVIGTKYGHILPSRPGKLYVGGLLVCLTDAHYGYDLLPQHIKLERDRQTVNDWDLYWLLKNLWLSTEDYDRLAEMMEKEVPDVKHIEYDCPQLLKEVCYRKFKAANPGAIAVKSQAELEAVVAKGMVKTVFIGGGYYAAVSGAAEHRQTYTQHMRAQTPAEILNGWLEKNQREMRLPIRIAFKQLLALASKWKA